MDNNIDAVETEGNADPTDTTVDNPATLNLPSSPSDAIHSPDDKLVEKAYKGNVIV